MQPDISIIKAETKDFRLVSDLGRTTFQESHGHSAPIADITTYTNKKFSEDAVIKELGDPAAVFHIIYYEHQAAGYSKVLLNTPYPEINFKHVTKLERLYLLEKFHHLKLGFELLKFNIELSEKNNQTGMWLHVWKDNHIAVAFYKKAGFRVAGSYDFQISENHVNPNHLMFLKY